MTTSRRWGALCLGLTAFTSFVFSPPLLGQNPTPPAVVGSSPAPGAATGEAARVIVTGSNIPSAEEVVPNPVDTYNRDYMNKSEIGGGIVACTGRRDGGSCTGHRDRVEHSERGRGRTQPGRHLQP